jgi:hypothetical protein
VFVCTEDWLESPLDNHIVVVVRSTGPEVCMKKQKKKSVTCPCSVHPRIATGTPFPFLHPVLTDRNWYYAKSPASA